MTIPVCRRGNVVVTCGSRFVGHMHDASDLSRATRLVGDLEFFECLDTFGRYYMLNVILQSHEFL